MSDASHDPPQLPEPTTPTWLTALGGVLLFVVGVWFLATSTAGKGASGDSDAGAPAAAAAAPAPSGGAARPAAPPH